MKKIAAIFVLVLSFMFFTFSSASAEQGNFEQCRELCGVTASCNQCCVAQYNECKGNCYTTRKGCITQCLQNTAQGSSQKSCEESCATGESACSQSCDTAEFDISACAEAGKSNPGA